MNPRTLATLACRLLAVHYAVLALRALVLALVLAHPAAGGNDLAVTWPLAATVAGYGVLAAALFRWAPALAARLAASGPEPGPDLAAGTLVAVGLALVGLTAVLDGGTEMLRLLPLLRHLRTLRESAPDLAGAFGNVLFGDPGARLVAKGLQAAGGGLLFLLAKPLARWWVRIGG